MTTASALQWQPTAADISHRLATLSAAAAAAGAEAVLVCPGADLRYFLGHSVPSHERLTALIVPTSGPAHLVVPVLERAGWDVPGLDSVTVSTWADGDDPYQAVAAVLGRLSGPLLVDDGMPAVHLLGLQAALTPTGVQLASPLTRAARQHKSEREVEALLAVGAAIDRVHRRMPEWLQPGRTENEIAADIAAAIVQEGHSHADFVIVASGPNGASPHHRASDRVLQPGDPVVIDIGGPAPSGYNSDCTRTYQLTGPAPAGFQEVYDVVRDAQRAAVAAVRPGVTAESIDAIARDIITDAGYGEEFITRTGHGIGLEVHEHPYIVAGNTLPLASGMTFSVEPGIYLPGRFGVRIEDIVIVTDDGVQLANTTSTDLTLIPPLDS